MGVVIREGQLDRFEHSHFDVAEEVRLMAEARHEGPSEAVATAPSFLSRLFQRRTTLPRAA